ncbi:MAG: alanine racemase [Tepidanaerobacteraceae bacterium]|jgi:alanine racemase
MNLTSWVEVDIDVVSNNVKLIKNFIGNKKLMAVVKSDAYGHGIEPIAYCAVESGADYLGVATLEEGILLREKGITSPVLVFNTILPDQADFIVKNDLTATVCSFDVVKSLDEAARRINKKACIHVKVDTGFGRFGLLPEHAIEFIKIIITNFDCLSVEGIYTHFSSASSETLTRAQYEKFKCVLEKLTEIGYDIPIKHCCNSTAAYLYRDMHLDMVRVGNLMYGLSDVQLNGIKPAAKIFSKVIALKNLPSGHNVGYGNKYITKRPTLVGVVPFGYYDGLELNVLQPNGIFDRLKALIKELLRSLGFKSVQPTVKIKDKYCNIIGKIGMQSCIIDLTNLKKEVIVGDTVELKMRKVNLCYNIPRIYQKTGQTIVGMRMVFPEYVEMDAKVKKRREVSIG